MKKDTAREKETPCSLEVFGKGMTAASFNLLHHLIKLRLIERAGTHLATRLSEVGGIHLYHLPAGFFVEVHDDGARNTVTRVHGFDETQALESWVEWVRLPE